MDELTNKVLRTIISEQIKNNRSEIVNSICNTNTSPKMNYEELYAQMILNSVEVSVELSIKIISDLLIQNGIIEADPVQMRKFLLKPLEE